jgi:hypothetical protein
MNLIYNNAFAAVGLTKSDQKVYVVGREHGVVSSAQLVSLCRLPRPTVMAALQHLVALGVCVRTKKDGRSMLYEMLPPTFFKGVIGSRIRELDMLSDALDAVAIPPKIKTHTKEAYGWEEVQDLIELALRCKSRTWHIIAPQQNALSHMPKEYVAYFKKVRQERQIESQSLWEEASMKELHLKDILMRKPRYVPKDIAPHIPTLQLAFDDSVLIIELASASAQPYALLIQNAAVTNTFRIVFEMAWRSAKKN